MASTFIETITDYELDRERQLVIVRATSDGDELVYHWPFDSFAKATRKAGRFLVKCEAEIANAAKIVPLRHR